MNNDELFADTLYTPKEGVEQYREREHLKNAVSKASDETINKRYAEYQQYELHEKDEKIGKASGKYVTGLYSSGISEVIQIRM